MNDRSPVIAALGEILWDLFPDGARFGGAPANFAHHAASFNAEVWLVSGVGNDPLGNEAVQNLTRSALNLKHVSVMDSYPTGSVQITLNSKGEADYRFGEDEAWDHLDVSPTLDELAVRCDAVCFGTLGQRHQDSRKVIERFIHLTNKKCFRVLDLNLRSPYIDPMVVHTSLNLANVLKLNDEELDYLASQFALPGKTHQARVQELADRFDLQAVALTLGAQGAILYRDGMFFHVEAGRVEVADTVGAGDAFTAVVVMGLVLGSDFNEVAKSACRVAEYVCGQSGATPIIPEAIVPTFLPSHLRGDQPPVF